MKQPKPANILKAIKLSLKIEGQTIIHPLNFELKQGESLAITGASGSGKTMLGRLLVGQFPPSAGQLVVRQELRRMMVDQQDHFIAFSGRRSMHDGLRYENQAMETVPTVWEFLAQVQLKSKTGESEAVIWNMLSQLEIEHLAGRKLLQLSNGERKRTQLAAVLLQKPDLLVLDQPFVGLDFHSRENLGRLLTQQMDSGICLVVITDPQHIPGSIHWVAELKNGRLSQFVKRFDYQPDIVEFVREKGDLNLSHFAGLPKLGEGFGTIVRMNGVNVVLGGKQILKNISWQVKPGEQWALLGPNGAGKSTLLSLITADNPQGYTNDLILFDRQRGTGESIWDIKKRIGFVSPELHLYFLRGAGIYNTIPGLGMSANRVYSSLTCRDVVLSGFHDEVGFTSAPTDDQQQIAASWLAVLGLQDLQQRLFVHASLGEQRVVLLARAMVKSPPLLILDEPCQGLDLQQTSRFVYLLNVLCRQLKTSLIYVTHRKEEIPGCVTHLLQLENGEVKSEGTFDASVFHWNR
jgi:molybdate transport system ATP-binding protein